jgi:methylated-DNA-[protein]-cysteine S-methyltransferase
METAGKTAWIGELRGTPLSPLWAAVSDRGLVAVGFPEERGNFTQQLGRMGFDHIITDPDRIQPVLAQIGEYLDGRRKGFDLPIDWSVMTLFQQQALSETCAIPHGQTATYGEIASRIGRPRAARAVGRAQATNPMPLVIPCHRVLGADGGLHGYGAGEGLKTKEWLLKLEGN